jgi:hypothetical protein
MLRPNGLYKQQLNAQKVFNNAFQEKRSLPKPQLAEFMLLDWKYTAANA